MSIENSSEGSDEILLDLCHVQGGQIRYLQEGHSALLLQGQLNLDVAGLYRTLQKKYVGVHAKISRLVREVHYYIGSQRSEPKR